MDKKIRSELFLLGGIIIFSAIGARFFMRGETLEEYNKNRQVAAATSAESITTIIPEESSSSEGSSSSEYFSSSEASSLYELSSLNESDSDHTENGENKVTFSDGFYYKELPQNVIDRITGVSYTPNDNISLDDLRYCVVLYNNFEGETKSGELICNKAIADDFMEIFHELYISGYQIESIKLVDEFGGDDTASMLSNNTSCFNYRVVDNTTRLSNHAYGLAIDINPFYNPYITYGKDGTMKISPEGSEAYADRSASFPYKIDENDLAYRLFKEHGFKWGGDWNSVKDYQHFEKKLD